MQLMYDLREMAYALLERIGQTRKQGASQTMLSRCSGVDPRNIFSPLTQLEKAGLMYVRVSRVSAALHLAPLPARFPQPRWCSSAAYTEPRPSYICSHFQGCQRGMVVVSCVCLFSV